MFNVTGKWGTTAQYNSTESPRVCGEHCTACRINGTWIVWPKLDPGVARLLWCRCCCGR